MAKHKTNNLLIWAAVIAAIAVIIFLKPKIGGTMAFYNPVTTDLVFSAPLEDLTEQVSGSTMTVGGSATSVTGAVGKAYQFDGSVGTKIIYAPAAKPELVYNPGFDSSGSPSSLGWNLYVDTASANATGAITTVAGQYNSSPSAYKITVTNTGATTGPIEFYNTQANSPLSIESGKSYKLSFKAKTTSPYTIKVELMKGGSPYNTYYSDKGANPSLTTTWNTYTIYFLSSATVSDARINFYLGSLAPNGSTTYFDDISFTEVPSSIRNAVTIEAWVYPTSTGHQGYIMSQYQTVMLQYDTAGNVQGGIWDGASHYWDPDSSIAIPINCWTHVAYTYDTTIGGKFYKNGTLVGGTLGLGLLMFPVTATVGIGGKASDDSRQFYGMVDEARIYDRALSASEVLNEYQYRTTTPSPPPVENVIDLPNMPYGTASIAYVITVTNTGDAPMNVTFTKAAFLGEYS